MNLYKKKIFDEAVSDTIHRYSYISKIQQKQNKKRIQMNDMVNKQSQRKKKRINYKCRSMVLYQFYY